MIVSCRTTKFIPEGQYLLDKVIIETDTKIINKDASMAYVAQKPNYKTFQVFKFPLFVYNLSGKDSLTWINKTIRNAGEAPILFDSILINRTISSLSTMAFNKGFLDAEVTADVSYSKKKVQITYDIETNAPYIVDTFQIVLADSVFAKPDSLVITGMKFSRKRINIGTLDKAIYRRSLIKTGDRFDLDVLNEERNRIVTFLRTCGYYSFSEEYIGFELDTLSSDHKVNIQTVFYPLAVKGEGGKVHTVPHRQYIVEEVLLNLDYDPYATKGIMDSAIVVDYGGYRLSYGSRGKYLRPHIVLNKCFIVPNELYNELLTNQTYSALSQLNILKNINISYHVIDDKLKCVITAIPQKKQEVSVELEGTNSGGFFGLGSGITYKHRNIFKRSEELRIGVKGEYEMVTPNFGSFDDNYFEIGLEAGLTIPRFMMPFMDKDFRRATNATSQLKSSYVFQRRPGYFTRTVFSTGLTYNWNSRVRTNTRHKLNLLEVNYIHVPELDSIFKQGLSVGAQKYSFSDQFIISTGYTFSKSNSNSVNKWKKPIYNFTVSVESAGNALYLLSDIVGLDKNADGERKIFGTIYAQYLRGTLDYSRTFLLDDNNSIAWHIGFGMAYPYGNFKEVPIQKRFFAGGGNSVRGWAVRTLGPGAFRPKSRDKEFDNFFYHSGDLKFDFNIEYRSKLFWLFEMATFVDLGNVWTIKNDSDRPDGQFKFDSFYKQIAAAWGVGLRMDFDYFLLRVDVGFKAYDPEANGSGVGEKTERWPIRYPYKLNKNAALHIAVGYPF